MPLIRLFSGDTYIHIQTQKREEKKMGRRLLLTTPQPTNQKKKKEPGSDHHGRPPAEAERRRLSQRAGWSFSFTNISYKNLSNNLIDMK